MKRVNITELPLFTFDNISSAFRVAELMYPEGVEIYIPKGTYRTNEPINARLLSSDEVLRTPNGVIRLYMESRQFPKPTISLDTMLRAL